ncbi:hypothetical protein LOC67_14230 [Stieleria sp. JC731]|uniref:hypothetical protein n=1 Tax=Pirellulaceae TaxID=2691357 RepID=UPI001E335E0F|nr:hypothetical protein [Stieleria sp. JC731]MCC9601713.1 hypothetical protein [Stieleria sp. JC731]
MNKRHFAFGFGLLATMTFALLPGCSQPSTTTVSESGEGEHSHDDHDHDGHDHGDHDHSGHDHDDDHSHDFKSIDEALAEITELNADIAEHLKNADAAGAHDPLHHVGEVLIAAEEMVAKMEDSDKKTTADKAIKSLINDFTAVDATLHDAPEEADTAGEYDRLKSSIQASIDELKGLE